MDDNEVENCWTLIEQWLRSDLTKTDFERRKKGWLTSNSELHVRLSGSACKFFNCCFPNNAQTEYNFYIACAKYIVQPLCADECDVDTVAFDRTFARADAIGAQSSVTNVQSGSQPPLSTGSFSTAAHGRTQPVLLSTLEINRCRVHRGEHSECWGTLYKPGDDVTFYVETNDMENTAITIEFHRQEIKPTPKDVQYLVIHPMARAPSPSLKISFQRHWKKRRTMEIGHRGMGTSFVDVSQKNVKKPAPTKENTLDSFRTAVQHGADFVEMDVQLTKDHRVIVYHDYETVIISKKKRGGRLSYLPIAIKDLNYEDLRELKVHHSSVLQEEHTHEKMDEEDLDPIELQSFPLLRFCFEDIDPNLGFVIEVKYPMEYKTGGCELNNFFEYNFYVDTILHEIIKYAGPRRIMLSCFDPNVCAMLQLKQNLYPVFQLGVAPEYSDSRQSDFEHLFWSAISHQLLGVCLGSDRVLEEPHVIKLAHMHSLVVLAWGEAVNCPDKRKQLSDLGVDGIIYDRLHESRERGTLNVFQLEARTASPSPTPHNHHVEEQCAAAAASTLNPAGRNCDAVPVKSLASTHAFPAIQSNGPETLFAPPMLNHAIGSTHVAVCKERMEYEKLSHTNSTTTCDSLPPTSISVIYSDPIACPESLQAGMAEEEQIAVTKQSSNPTASIMTTSSSSVDASNTTDTTGMKAYDELILPNSDGPTATTGSPGDGVTLANVAVRTKTSSTQHAVPLITLA